jgi:8-hydroxy-5-deazaflavin:NADPH oxidoreductase
MKFGILGTGVVGQTVGAALIKKGHEVKLGTRDPQSETVTRWVGENGATATAGTFADAAAFGEILMLATRWDGTENAIHLADPKNFAGKVLIDITNPLKFGADGPALAIGFSDSAGEQVQRWLPEARVVKALNHAPAALMVDANFLGESVDAFIAGNDAKAKEVTIQILEGFGWPVIDLGGIEQSRLIESLTGLWVRYYQVSGDWRHAVKLVRAK